MRKSTINFDTEEDRLDVARAYGTSTDGELHIDIATVANGAEKRPIKGRIKWRVWLVSDTSSGI